jgi:hypothetical protein
MEVINDFQKMADLAEKFNCVYIEFCKVFGKVSIPLLLKK